MRLRHLSATLAAVAICGAVSAPAAIFEPLFMVTKVVGDAWIVRPGSKAAEPLLADRAYPYGSRVRVAEALSPAQLAAFKARGAEPEDPQVSFTMSRDYRFRFSAGTDAVLLDASEEGAEKKVIDVSAGSVSTFITAASTKTGGAADAIVEANLSAVVVRTPVGECSRLTQRNQIQVGRDARDPAIYSCQFASQSGLMEISGPQYKLSNLKKNTVVNIEGTEDFTSISSQYGEFLAEIEKGADAVEKVRFRTRCVGKIWREYADVGGRMAVSVMISYPDGKLVTYTYLEGQTGVGHSAAAGSVAGDAGGQSGDAQDSPFGDAADLGDSAADDAPSSGDSASDAFDFGDW